MKFKKIDSITAPSVRGQQGPFITLRLKGASTINKTLTNATGLKGGDRIAFFQDEDEPDDWYLAKDGKDGFETRGNYDKKSGSLIFNAAAAVRKIFEAKDWTEESAKCAVKTEPLKQGKDNYFLILFSSASENIQVIKRSRRSKSGGGAERLISEEEYLSKE